MWVVNNDKERAKIYLKSDIESNITNLCDVNDRIRDTVAAINKATAGSPSGADQQMIDDCKKAMKEIEESLHTLQSCRTYVDQLETREWVEDK